MCYSVAINSAPRIHLEIQSRGNRHYGIFRSSYRVGADVRHRTHGRVSGIALPRLRLMQAALRDELVPRGSAEAIKVLESRECGASAALLQLAKDLGLDRLLYSRAEPWVKGALAMIIGRVLYAGSKLALSQVGQVDSPGRSGPRSALWEICGIEGEVDVDTHCYEPMDRLLERQPAIQKALAKQHLHGGQLVLYDLTSSYFEGEYAHSDLVTFGYNRDGKKGHEQVVIGLLCNAQGCPVGIQVFTGNTKDSTTTLAQVQRLKHDYGLEKLIWVGDRGTITQANAALIRSQEDLHSISALTHPEIVKLLDRKVIQAELFDEKNTVEVLDPEDPAKRYCLCRNPETTKRETQTRRRLLDCTRVGLEKIAAAKAKKKDEVIGARVGKLLARYKLGKFVVWSVKEGKLQWTFDEAAIAAEQVFDGCYVIRADVPKELMAATELVLTYKSLSLVEQGFRNLKTVSLEMRPMYHKTDDRIRSHVFICFLAYYLQWHLTQRLQPLFAKDGKGKERRWTIQNVLATLKGIQRNRIQVEGVEVEIDTQADADQQEILDLLKTKP